jgi:type I site-specific restriction-modification system R (restriction) subunit
MSYIIYKTTNIINGKYYIGVTNGKNPNYLGSGRSLRDAIKQYGRKNFVRETLEVFESEYEAYKREAQIVNENFVADRNTYNIGKGGKGGPGQPKSEEHINAIKRSHLRKSNPGAGRPPAMDTKELIDLCDTYGKRKAAEILGISLSACRSRYYRLK